MEIRDRVLQNLGVLGQWSKLAHGYFMFPKLEGEIGPHMTFRGKDILNWSINNYYGLASNPDIKAKEAELAIQYGFSNPMGSRLMTGQTTLHETLESKIAEFVKMEDCFVLNSFYQGMISIIDSLCCKNDTVIYSFDVHSSIQDGIRLHSNRRFIYYQNDIDAIEEQVKKACEAAKEKDGGVLFVTEGVIGVTGELAPLDKIVALKEKYDFLLIVEDAHGFGTIGPNRIGAADYYGVQDKVDLLVGTFGKAMSITGGFVAGSEDLINYLRYNMRSQTFSEALPSAITASAINRLDYIINHPEQLKKLNTITEALQKGLRKAGLNIGNTTSAVTPVYMEMENIQEAVHMMMDLRENFGIFCVNILYPYIEEGKVMIRLIPTPLHTIDDVNFTIDALTKIAENTKAGKYRDNNPIEPTNTQTEENEE
ncbi:MAG: aminotransferase class I/II-fold pyridoxal phosphate-dependent enzyme [Paludibacteraceae bacterium]|nr:aminotransferase class I/II-fold pyridoxal phosphate-dependent enzyme [Paludibacteraceae bacterium]